MARFLYEAKKSPKDVIKGVLAADNRASAIQKIGKMGYYVISLKEENLSAVSSEGTRERFFGRVTLKDITDFTRQLADLLGPVQLRILRFLLR